jgi:sigma-E factor negative regulatory protein RseC
MTDKEYAMSPGTGYVAPDETGALARVVAIDVDQVWLEPLQTGSCGGCASAALCGTKGIGTLANRLEARRFAVRGKFALSVGDSVEVAFGNRNLVKAAAVAYAIPLLSALVCAGLIQYQAGQDGLTVLGALLGMLCGFIAMKFVASRLEADGTLQARIVRPHQQQIHFSPSGTQCDA